MSEEMEEGFGYGGFSGHPFTIDTNNRTEGVDGEMMNDDTLDILSSPVPGGPTAYDLAALQAAESESRWKQEHQQKKKIEKEAVPFWQQARLDEEAAKAEAAARAKALLLGTAPPPTASSTVPTNMYTSGKITYSAPPLITPSNPILPRSRSPAFGSASHTRSSTSTAPLLPLPEGFQHVSTGQPNKRIDFHPSHAFKTAVASGSPTAPVTTKVTPPSSSRTSLLPSHPAPPPSNAPPPRPFNAIQHDHSLDPMVAELEDAIAIARPKPGAHPSTNPLHSSLPLLHSLLPTSTHPPLSFAPVPVPVSAPLRSSSPSLSTVTSLPKSVPRSPPLSTPLHSGIGASNSHSEKKILDKKRKQTGSTKEKKNKNDRKQKSSKGKGSGRRKQSESSSDSESSSEHQEAVSKKDIIKKTNRKVNTGKKGNKKMTKLLNNSKSIAALRSAGKITTTPPLIRHKDTPTRPSSMSDVERTESEGSSDSDSDSDSDSENSSSSESSKEQKPNKKQKTSINKSSSPSGPTVKRAVTKPRSNSLDLNAASPHVPLAHTLSTPLPTTTLIPAAARPVAFPAVVSVPLTMNEMNTIPISPSHSSSLSPPPSPVPLEFSVDLGRCVQIHSLNGLLPYHLNQQFRHFSPDPSTCSRLHPFIFHPRKPILYPDNNPCFNDTGVLPHDSDSDDDSDSESDEEMPNHPTHTPSLLANTTLLPLTTPHPLPLAAPLHVPSSSPSSLMSDVSPASTVKRKAIDERVLESTASEANKRVKLEAEDETRRLKEEAEKRKAGEAGKAAQTEKEKQAAEAERVRIARIEEEKRVLEEKRIVMEMEAKMRREEEEEKIRVEEVKRKRIEEEEREKERERERSAQAEAEAKARIEREELKAKVEAEEKRIAMEKEKEAKQELERQRRDAEAAAAEKEREKVKKEEEEVRLASAAEGERQKSIAVAVAAAREQAQRLAAEQKEKAKLLDEEEKKAMLQKQMSNSGNEEVHVSPQSAIVSDIRTPTELITPSSAVSDADTESTVSTPVSAPVPPPIPSKPVPIKITRRTKAQPSGSNSPSVERSRRSRSKSKSRSRSQSKRKSGSMSRSRSTRGTRGRSISRSRSRSSSSSSSSSSRTRSRSRSRHSTKNNRRRSKSRSKSRSRSRSRSRRRSTSKSRDSKKKKWSEGRDSTRSSERDRDREKQRERDKHTSKYSEWITTTPIAGEYKTITVAPMALPLPTVNISSTSTAAFLTAPKALDLSTIDLKPLHDVARKLKSQAEANGVESKTMSLEKQSAHLKTKLFLWLQSGILFLLHAAAQHTQGKGKPIFGSLSAFFTFTDQLLAQELTILYIIALRAKALAMYKHFQASTTKNKLRIQLLKKSITPLLQAAVVSRAHSHLHGSGSAPPSPIPQHTPPSAATSSTNNNNGNTVSPHDHPPSPSSSLPSPLQTLSQHSLHHSPLAPSHSSLPSLSLSTSGPGPVSVSIPVEKAREVMTVMEEMESLIQCLEYWKQANILVQSNINSDTTSNTPANAHTSGRPTLSDILKRTYGVSSFTLESMTIESFVQYARQALIDAAEFYHIQNVTPLPI